MRLSERRIVHWDFHYAKAMLFSACRLWYYIILSLHHFQRLPFLPIKLNSMLRTFRACFWTCLTLLLWSHIHSHTHLFGFSNLAISCGCPALSIWVFVVIYASHLSDTSSPWVISPLSVLPLQLFSPSKLASRRSGHPPFPPPRDDAGWDRGLHRDVSLQRFWLGWAGSSFPYDFTRSGGFPDFLATVQRPLALLVSVSTAIGAWRPSLGALPQDGCRLSCHTLRNRTPHSSVLCPGLLSTSSLAQGGYAEQGVWGGWRGVPWRHVWLSPAGHIGIMGVSLTAGPRCDLAGGSSTQYSGSGQHPGTFLWLNSANKATFVKAGVFRLCFNAIDSGFMLLQQDPHVCRRRLLIPFFQ